MSAIESQIFSGLSNILIDGISLNLDNCADIQINHEKVNVSLELGFACESQHETIREQIYQSLPDIQFEKITITQNVARSKTHNAAQLIRGVKNIIAVASGKGGVGKSTTAVNLALALSKEGARVGLLDADIYGPSQTQMLGLVGVRPEVKNGNRIIPPIAYDIQCISMGNLVTEKTPMVWRGPMVSGALQQLLNNTQWDDVDYLIVDMPPGTGDIQLTLSQSVPVSGALIVTTPQNIALLDAQKGIEMFRKVSIPVLGVVENMATHTCSNCGHTEAIFGEGGGDRLALDYEVNVLGRLPLTLEIREQTDAGTPSVAQDSESKISLEYRQIARRLAANLWVQSLESAAGPEIEIADD